MEDAVTPLDEWLKRLESLSAWEIDMGLERVGEVLARLALELPATIIHVAGTNGKGSSVAVLEGLLAPAEKVGSYTSPHVRRYNERIRVDALEADDAVIVDAFEHVEAVRDNIALTYFEYSTLAALVVFAEAKVDVGILEIGMGGRLDAVNAVEPSACLITNVSMDHSAWLGSDIETIAREKAGIMRPGRPVVFGSGAVPDAILRQAAAVGADLRLAGRDFRWSAADNSWSWHGMKHKLRGLSLPALAGRHQLDNAAAVLALLEQMGRTELLSVERVNPVMLGLRVEGRMQRVPGDARWLLDVAHNPASAAALAAVLGADATRPHTIAILGILDDKDVEGITGFLAPHVDEWIAVEADSPRAIPAGELGRRVANLTNRACLVAASITDAIARASGLADEADRILVTGSFHVVGPALTELYSRPTS